MTVLSLLSELLPSVIKLVSDIVDAGDDEEKVEQARMKHDREVSDILMRARLGIPGAP